MPKDPEPRVVPDFSHVWDKDPRRFSCCGGSKRIGDITIVVLVVVVVRGNSMSVQRQVCWRYMSKQIIGVSVKKDVYTSWIVTV